MRYNQDSTASLVAIESSAQPPIPTLYEPSVSAYNSDTSAGAGGYYSSTSHVYPGLEVRARLNSSNPSSTGMAHAHRSTALPHPPVGTRDYYSSATPAYRREAVYHTPRSPSYSGLPSRRHPLSPTASPISSLATNTVRMDTSQAPRPQTNIPPLNPLTSLGTLQMPDGTSAKIEINGTIDKGFFLAESEWTCYRRNYFSCICSYSLSPPCHPNQSLQFIQSGTQQSYTVYGFAMCISAVVADSESHTIDLVQHTPKRDKGPTGPPEKVRLSSKPLHAQLAMYGSDGSLGPSRAYDQGFAQAPGAYPTEHTFERIQFKHATANNGKRRAAQQYYHLRVELWADVGSQAPSQTSDGYIKIAYRKSAKMIVRGRSPGHYHSDRRGSANNPPGGAAGGLGSGFPASIMGSDYSGPVMMGSSQYAPTGYDPRSGGYGHTRHAPLHSHGHHSHVHHSHAPHRGEIATIEPIITEEPRTIDETTKAYSYYPPSPMYEGSSSDHDSRPPAVADMYTTHPRSDHHGGSISQQQPAPPPTVVSGFDIASSSKVKHEYEGALPSIVFATSNFISPRCGSRLDNKPGSTDYYTSMVPPPSTLNMT